MVAGQCHEMDKGRGPSPSSCLLFPFWKGVVFVFDVQTLFSQLLNEALNVLVLFLNGSGRGLNCELRGKGANSASVSQTTPKSHSFSRFWRDN